MAELKLERHFDAPPERVFEFVTKTEHLIKWWGPEGINLGDHQLDLTQHGPWFSVMHGEQGVQYKVTGQVTAINPGESVTFTWAWHDEDDVRGDDSSVTFAVADDGGGGTNFTMVHRGLADDDSAHNHEEGWTSSFVKLNRYVGQVAACNSEVMTVLEGEE